MKNCPKSFRAKWRFIKSIPEGSSRRSRTWRGFSARLPEEFAGNWRLGLKYKKKDFFALHMGLIHCNTAIYNMWP
jgi:hypothetical protein